MEFPAKLQDLRKSRGLTQEELARELYISRTAISKWESGRGYPSIDSLKAISRYLHVSLDELLSGEEILDVAEAERREERRRFRDIVFGSLDCAMAMLFFIPLFGQATTSGIEQVSLLSITGIEPYVKMCYLVGIAVVVLIGIATLVLQTNKNRTWHKLSVTLSLLASVLMVLVFIASMEPYAATLTFIFLAIKAFLLVKPA